MPERRRHDSGRIRTVVAVATVAVSIVALLSLDPVPSLNLPFTAIRIPVGRAQLVAFGIAVIGLVLRAAPLRWAVAFLTGSLALVAVTTVGYHSPRRGDRLIASFIEFDEEGKAFEKTWASPLEWHGSLYSYDEKVAGYRGKRGGRSRHYHPDFPGEVAYSFTEDGWRRTPSPSQAPVEPRPIVFLGCSYTFGSGVQDDETFASLLASKAWKRFHVENRAVVGYGTSHSLRVLQEVVLAGPTKPLVVFYGMIEHHLRRNYRRVFPNQNINSVFPLFEVESGKLLYRGMRTRNETGMPDGPELAAAEMKITIALLREMALICQRANVPFIVLAFDTLPKGIMGALGAASPIHVVELGAFAHLRYPRERHPTAAWHQAVASRLSSDPRVAHWTGVGDLLQPGAIALPPPIWEIAAASDPSAATLTSSDAGRGPIRVSSIRPYEDPNAITMTFGPIQVERQGEYRIICRLRSDAPRPIRAAVKSANSLDADQSFAEEVPLDRDWRTVEVPFKPTTPDRIVRLDLAIGGSTTPIEIADWKIEALAPSPR